MSRASFSLRAPTPTTASAPARLIFCSADRAGSHSSTAVKSAHSSSGPMRSAFAIRPARASRASTSTAAERPLSPRTVRNAAHDRVRRRPSRRPWPWRAAAPRRTFEQSSALDHMSRGLLAMVVARLGYVSIAVGLPGLVGTVVKRWIGRVRPSAAGPFAYEPLSWRPDYASFPSGHATTAFAALVAFGAVFPRARPVLWVYALLIAASRVVVSAHYPSDVIAGAAFGAFGALWVRDWFAVRRLGFFVGPDGAIHPMTGPSRRRIKRVVRALVAS